MRTAAAWLRLVLIVDVENYTEVKPEQKGSSCECGTVFDSFAVILHWEMGPMTYEGSGRSGIDLIKG